MHRNNVKGSCRSLSPPFASRCIIANVHDMNTIAITLDEPTLGLVDWLIADEHSPYESRSELIRTAVQLFAKALEREFEEKREAEIVHRHRRRLNLQAAVLINQQGQCVNRHS